MSSYGLLALVACTAVVLILGAAPPPDDLVKVVAELFPPPAKIVGLARQARSKDRTVREQARDELIPLLRVGMTRAQVETLLGPPDLETVHSAEHLYVTYVCRSKKFPRQQWWLIDYNSKEKPLRLVGSKRDSLFDEEVGDE